MATAASVSLAAVCSIGCTTRAKPNAPAASADAVVAAPIDRLDLFVRNAAREFVELSATREVRRDIVSWRVQRYDGQLRPIGPAVQDTDMAVRLLDSFDIWALNAPDAPGAACKTVRGQRSCSITFNDYSLVMRVQRGRQVRVQRYTGLEKSTSNPSARSLGDFVFAWAQTSGTDWSQWRGPTRNGVVAAALPSRWPEALKKRWEVKVGTGHASPVVSGNRVVVIAREGDQEIVRALDLQSGKEIWRAAYPAPFDVNPAARSHGPGPKSTPAIAGGRVFTFGIGGVLSAFDLASGKLLWRVPAPDVLPEYGTATSPLVDDTSVIAHVGGNGAGALMAFDAATGKPRWAWKGDGPAYGSPIIATLGGVRQVITQTQKLLVGVDASNGTLLWQMPFTTDFDQNAFTPVVFQDLLIVGGIDWPLTAIRVKLADGKWNLETAWMNDQTPMFMSSPVVIKGTIYGLTMRNRGQFVAVDAASGKTRWNTQGREGENASILGNASWLLASTTDGNLVVARANPKKYEEVRRYQIAESPVWAHPAITANSIIVKDVDKVICWSY